MAMKLYELVGRDAGRPFSPHCWKARLALKHKGLDFETVPVPFTGIPEIEGGASKIVPLLKDGETLVADSFVIAEYLEATYPDAPTLFGGEGGRRLARFVEAWSMATIHAALPGFVIMDIHDCLAEPDQAYFRQSREARMGRPLETVVEGREARVAPFLASLAPLRKMVEGQPFLGGETPLFADYIVFGAFQWLRVVSAFPLLPAEDPVTLWFERCLDLHDGHGRAVPAAAAA